VVIVSVLEESRRHRKADAPEALEGAAAARLNIRIPRNSYWNGFTESEVTITKGC
jgi:hypothetical protein